MTWVFSSGIQKFLQEQTEQKRWQYDTWGTLTPCSGSERQDKEIQIHLNTVIKKQAQAGDWYCVWTSQATSSWLRRILWGNFSHNLKQAVRDYWLRTSAVPKSAQRWSTVNCDEKGNRRQEIFEKWKPPGVQNFGYKKNKKYRTIFGSLSLCVLFVCGIT